MPVTINGTTGETTPATVYSGSTSGSITVQATAVAGTNTLTLPAKTGNIITSADTGTVSQTMIATGVGGTGPAFSAWLNPDTTIANTTYTKVTFDTKEFDTATNYSTANGRFTPTVAGYYQINCSINYGQGGGWLSVEIWKNGSPFKTTTRPNASGGSGNSYFGLSALVYMNGSTDYLEIYGWQSSGATLTLYGRQTSTFFQGVLVRSA